MSERVRIFRCRRPPPGTATILAVLLLATVVAGSASHRRAEAAPLLIRVGLVSGRWAADVSGRPAPGAVLSEGPYWPGQDAGEGVRCDGDGRFAVFAAAPRVVASAAESAWLARAVSSGLARTGWRSAAGSAAWGSMATPCGRARLGGIWYVLYDGLQGTDPGVEGLEGLPLPGFEVLWPCVPALGGRTDRPCIVPLSGDANGLSFSAPVPLKLSSAGSMVAHVSRRYRGSLEILPAGGLFSLVNVVDMEDYLLGVVPSEMPASWPLEALKAQAVAARTYAVRNLGKHKASGFDVCDEIHCQAYLGYANEYPGPTAAVRATAGIVATYGGRPINAFYHAHAGGATDSSAVIWGAAEPYLVGTSQTYERPYPWTVTCRRTEVEQAVAAIGVDQAGEGLFPLLSATPGEHTPGGRARTVALAGPTATAAISAERLRSRLGTYRLRSGAFFAEQVQTVWLWPDLIAAAGMTGGEGAAQALTWVPGARGSVVLVYREAAAGAAGGKVPLGLLSPEFFVFSGEGFGHGVGMSQWGAREMAAAGMSYTQILTQFYRGIALSADYGR